MYLIVLNGYEEGRMISVENPIRLGRADGVGNDVLLVHDNRISGVHALITPLPDGQAKLEDQSSTHGTSLDGRKLDGPALLRPGSVIQLGQTLLYLAGSAEDPALLQAARREMALPSCRA